MARITIIGVTGFAGAHIAREAVAQRHQVTGLSRTAPTDPIEGVTYATGSVADEETLASVVDGAEVVVAALSPRGDLAGKLVDAVKSIAGAAVKFGARLIVIGGAGALYVAPGGPRVVDGDDFPAFLLEEARQTASVVAWLDIDAPEGLDWTYVSSAVRFSPRDVGERTGKFTFAGNIAKFDSYISGPDFGVAIVDEIDKHAHSGHISVFS